MHCPTRQLTHPLTHQLHAPQACGSTLVVAWTAHEVRRVVGGFGWWWVRCVVQGGVLVVMIMPVAHAPIASLSLVFESNSALTWREQHPLEHATTQPLFSLVLTLHPRLARQGMEPNRQYPDENLFDELR